MRSAPKPCTKCGVLVSDGTARCDAHKHAGRFGDDRRGSRHERGYGAGWTKKREEVKRRDAGVCQEGLRLGQVHPGTEVDHRLPKARGGTDDLQNLQLICRACHKAKSAREGSQGRGAEKSPTPAPGTGRFPNFLRAQVMGEGGVNSGLGEQGTASSTMLASVGAA